VECVFEDARVAYLRGQADLCYGDRAQRCRRHIVLLKAQTCFLMIDEFQAQPGINSALQWNLHGWAPFLVDEEQRTFLLEREGSSLRGHFLYHLNSFFTLSEGWDPPPEAGKQNDQWQMQYNLRFNPMGLAGRMNLAVVLCPGHTQLKPPAVETQRVGATEVAKIGPDLACVNQGQGIEYENLRSTALAMLVVQGTHYEITDQGVGIS